MARDAPHSQRSLTTLKSSLSSVPSRFPHSALALVCRIASSSFVAAETCTLVANTSFKLDFVRAHACTCIRTGAFDTRALWLQASICITQSSSSQPRAMFEEQSLVDCMRERRGETRRERELKALRSMHEGEGREGEWRREKKKESATDRGLLPKWERHTIQEAEKGGG